ncbi:MAG: NigD-like protein [Mediterranea sp.]|jgi:hypothetical protein|nr:NigD-like protein [Mediterranea sp.]
MKPTQSAPAGGILRHSLFLLLLLAVAACKDDKYHYPSVKLEFVTLLSDEEGKVATLIPDMGDPLRVSLDRTASTFTPSSTLRALSNYETIGSGTTATAVIYSLQSPIVPTPKPASDEAFKDGIKHDPVNVTSIWMGRDYLNMILNLKVDTGKGHVFGIVEDTTELETAGVVTLSLYHDSAGDAEHYNRSAYLSIPLKQYQVLPRPSAPITIKFKYYTYDADGLATESDKYAKEGFVYLP